MKVRTNLSSGELEVIGEGLKRLAKSQTEGKDEIVLENTAEKELIRRADHLFDTMLTNLQDEVSNLVRSYS